MFREGKMKITVKSNLLHCTQPRSNKLMKNNNNTKLLKESICQIDCLEMWQIQELLNKKKNPKPLHCHKIEVHVLYLRKQRTRRKHNPKARVSTLKYTKCSQTLERRNTYVCDWMDYCMQMRCLSNNISLPKQFHIMTVNSQMLSRLILTCYIRVTQLNLTSGLLIFLIVVLLKKRLKIAVKICNHL